MYKILDEFPNYIISSDGCIINMKTGFVLYGSDKPNGYKEVSIRNANGQRKYVGIHRLIAKAFCQKPTGKEHINHIDGNKRNNVYTNLEWCTPSENIAHAFKTGLKKQDTSGKSVIATNIETGEETLFKTIYRAARSVGTSQGNICMTCQGKRPYAGGYYWRYAEGE